MQSSSYVHFKKSCGGQATCVKVCPTKAIRLKSNESIQVVDHCIGCGECIIICPNNAVQVQSNKSIPLFQENMIEYTFGVLKNKKNKALFLNFITDVSPACDCYPYNDAPIVRDIGVVAAKDPIAIDQASVDLVNREQALPNSCLETNIKPGEDKFKGVYPKVDWTIQLNYAESIGLGSRKYELVTI